MRTDGHARAIARVMAAYAERGTHLSAAALAGSRTFAQWQHYPSNDAVDAHHGTEFYYHAHAQSERLPNEHGHFHVFVRSHGARRFHHLIGISMNPLGVPIRLFLTNQWVTGEAWVGAEKILPRLNRFECTLRGRLAPVARWITGMVHLYHQDIAGLHRNRDRWHLGHTRNGNDRRHLSDQTHHIVAQQRVDFFRRLSQSHL